MTLYRIDNSEPGKTYSDETIGAFTHTTLGYLRLGVLVPIEPCGHSKIDGHTIEQAEDWTDSFNDIGGWCEGAGLEDS